MRIDRLARRLEDVARAVEYRVLEARDVEDVDESGVVRWSGTVTVDGDALAEMLHDTAHVLDEVERIGLAQGGDPGTLAGHLADMVEQVDELNRRHEDCLEGCGFTGAVQVGADEVEQCRACHDLEEARRELGRFREDSGGEGVVSDGGLVQALAFRQALRRG